jgi:hypothetical protein
LSGKSEKLQSATLTQFAVFVSRNTREVRRQKAEAKTPVLRRNY